MTRPRIGLALGSGAARGFAHIGVIRALAEAGIRPDIVCGSSVGALVGGAYATGQLDRLEEWARTFTRYQIVRFLDVSLSGGGLIEGGRLAAFLRDLYADATIEGLGIPFMAVAAELDTGRELWLREGSLTDAVRASTAMPGLFDPALLGGKWLIDGGVVNPVPVSACKALGAEIVIAVNLNGDLVRKRSTGKAQIGAEAEAERSRPRSELLEGLLSEIPPAIRDKASGILERFFAAEPDGPGYFDVVIGSVNIMQDHITRSRMAGEPPDVMLTPRSNRIGLLEIHRANEAIDEGASSVRRMLPALRDAIADQL